MQKEESRIRIELTTEQQKQIKAASGEDVTALEFTHQELEDIGLNARGYSSPAELVVLDKVFGLSYRYDEATQRILITAPEELLAVKEYNLRSPPPEMPSLQTDWGGVLNYNVYMSTGSPIDGRGIALNGASVAPTDAACGSV